MSVAGTQILVVPGTEETSPTAGHANNGPFGPVQVEDAITVTDIPGVCDVTPNTELEPETLAALVDTTVSNGPWTLLMDASVLDFCTITFDKVLTLLSAGVTDGVPGNNTLDLDVDLVRDFDNDTVPDDYAGIQDNCPTTPARTSGTKTTMASATSATGRDNDGIAQVARLTGTRCGSRLRNGP
jgi:hypothetical protein